MVLFTQEALGAGNLRHVRVARYAEREHRLLRAQSDLLAVALGALQSRESCSSALRREFASAACRQWFASDSHAVELTAGKQTPKVGDRIADVHGRQWTSNGRSYWVMDGRRL